MELWNKKEIINPKNKTIIMNQFTRNQLVEFGKFLLSKERKDTYKKVKATGFSLKDRLSVVNHADVENFIASTKTACHHSWKTCSDTGKGVWIECSKCGEQMEDNQSVEGMKNRVAELYEANRPKFQDWGTLKDMCIATAIQYAQEYGNQLVGDKEREYAELLEVKNNILAQRNEYMTAFDNNQEQFMELAAHAKDLEKEVEYWKARCLAAEIVIDSFPVNIKWASHEDMREHEQRFLNWQKSKTDES